MKSRRVCLSFGLIAILLSILACTINLGGPAYPSEKVPVSTAALVDLQTMLGTAEAEGRTSGVVTLTITESQLTSYFVSRLQVQSSRVAISDPQVYLRDGQIQLYATIKQGNFVVTTSAIFAAGVDEQGQLKLSLTSADFGPIPVPQNLRDVITSSIQEAFTGSIGPAAIGFRLESITIADGLLTVTGRTK